MRGETVKVVRYTPTGETDPGGSPVTKVDIESVDNVLVSPGAMSNATDSIRPDGVTVAFTCLFPAATHTGVCAGRVCASIHMTTR